MEIQLFLSKLVSNTNYALKAFENPRRFIKSQVLSNEVSQQFVQFMEIYGSQFIASSLVLRRKRFLDVVTALDLLANLYSETQLEKFWHRYLSNFELHDAVPKNPLMESIVFCQYLLGNEKLSDVEYEFVHYEMIRNKTTVDYGLHGQGYLHLRLLTNEEVINEISFFGSEEIAFFLHPCMKVQSFDCNISELVKLVKKDQSLREISALFRRNKEDILFYKNWHKGIMTSVKISELVKEMIGIINNSIHAGDVQENIKSKLNITVTDYMKIVQTLIQAGIILVITNVNQEVSVV